MSTLLQDHLALIVLGAIVLVALLVLAAVARQMHAAKRSPRPVVFVGVFFAVVCVPQLLVHGATRLWPKPQAELDAAAMAGIGAFARPEAVFGADVEPARLRDARPVYGQALASAEVAQFLIRDDGQTAVAARFADAEGARRGAAALWRMFSPQNTSGDGLTTFGTRTVVGDIVGLRRVGRGVFLWTGPDRGSIEARIARSRSVRLTTDARPRWLAAFDDWRVATAAVVLLAVAASLGFLKGAAWAARTDPDANRAPVGAAELGRRLAALPLARLGDGRWEMLVRHERLWESGTYRYVLELDDSNRRVKVLEYLSGRETRADGPRWTRQVGITFFRRDVDLDLQHAKEALVRTVTGAGWRWQPLLFDAPRWLAWLAG